METEKKIKTSEEKYSPLVRGAVYGLTIAGGELIVPNSYKVTSLLCGLIEISSAPLGNNLAEELRKLEIRRQSR